MFHILLFSFFQILFFFEIISILSFNNIISEYIKSLRVLIFQIKVNLKIFYIITIKFKNKRFKKSSIQNSLS